MDIYIYTHMHISSEYTSPTNQLELKLRRKLKRKADE